MIILMVHRLEQTEKGGTRSNVTPCHLQVYGMYQYIFIHPTYSDHDDDDDDDNHYD